MLEARNLRKSFGRLVATDDVSLEFGREPGEMVFIVGPNGAGKTTLVNLLTGLLEPDAGSVVLHERDEAAETTVERDITDASPAERVHTGIVRSFQVVQVFEEMTVRENLRTAVLSEAGLTRSMFSFSDEHEDVEAVVEEVFDVFEELDDHRDALVENLSGGQAKMVAIGRALALRPDLLVLDEPLEGLAPVVVERLKGYIEAINERDIAVLIAESNLSHLPDVVDRLYVVERGEIVDSGDPRRLVRDPEIQKLMHGSGQE